MLDPATLFPAGVLPAEKEKHSTTVSETKAVIPPNSNMEQSELFLKLESMERRLQTEISGLKNEINILQDRIQVLESQDQPAHKIPEGDVIIQRYSQALELFNRKDYENAQNMFAEITLLSDTNIVWFNSMYWNAECAFHLGKYNESVILLSEVLEHPRQEFREKSLLLLAVAIEKLNRIEDARLYYRQFAKTYPYSVYSVYVRQKLGDTQGVKYE